MRNLFNHDFLYDDIGNFFSLKSKSDVRNLISICQSNRVIDLLFCLPKNYVDRRGSLIYAKSGDIVTFTALILSHHPGNKRKKIPYRVIVKTERGNLELIFFNYSLGYLLNCLIVGKQCLISGKLSIFLGGLQIVHPDYILKNISKYNEIARLEPIYSSFKSLTSLKFSYYIKYIIDRLPNISEWLNGDLIAQNNWSCFSESLRMIHLPKSSLKIEKYRSRIAYDELLSRFIALKFIRKSYALNNGSSNSSKKLYYNYVLNNLDFELTKSQANAIEQITQEQASSQQMMCLLQGDVGSGKTVVGLFAALNVLESGRQVAFMVPTEILAEQHYLYFIKILSELKINIELLTGKVKGKKREIIKKKLKDSSCEVLIGTHALFQEGIEFNNLSLIIIDEQQRFGVMQRMKLIEKGNGADILFMTATPIPRTLQQILYGDMQCIKLMEKPKCRLPIKTTIINSAKLDILVDRIGKLIAESEKVYWICPYIEESENSDIAAVENRFFDLQKKFGSIVGIMHGKLTQLQKEEMMINFRNGEIKILVATTVIEVGVDVSDATIMVIENAERFGLSQLHQLRGRVGRGGKHSFCILLCNRLSKSSYSKLQVLCQSQDGFYIAEQDLLFRGGGNILGLNQSGITNFRFVNLETDQSLIDLSNHHADSILAEDEFLENSDNIKILLKIFGYESLLCMNY